MSVFLTSDLHFGHSRIHEFRSDRFSSQKEHDDYILNEIRSLSKRDVLFILGDFIFDSKNYDYYISQLKEAACRIKLVMGNHDSLKLYNEDRFEIQLPLFSYKGIWLSHPPIHESQLRGRLGNVHGHIHSNGNYEYEIHDKRYFNVNIDCNNYKFVSLEAIKNHYKD